MPLLAKTRFLAFFLLIFMSLNIVLEAKFCIAASMSMPDQIWISLSNEIRDKKIDASFVLQGLPNNSFKELAEKIKELSDKGFSANVELDPTIFEDFQIGHVPVFLSIGKGQADRISGNLSLSYVLQVFEQEGDVSLDDVYSKEAIR